MNRAGVLLVGLPREGASEQVATAAVSDMKTEKCTQLSVLAVAHRLRFLLSRVLTGLYIAAIAIRITGADNCM